jgi:putative ABC transport system ATP-binding protein
MIKLKKIEKSFGSGEAKVTALGGVNLEIKDGSLVVLLGPSGSGKSTLLNVVSGLDKIDSGSIQYGDTNIAGFNQKKLTEFRKEKIGFIFQAYYLLPNLTVRDNIELGANLTNASDYTQLVNDLGLAEHMHKYPHQLSGGQQQRVSIARALAKKPEVLFCDEPTGALDEKTGKDVLKALQELNKNYKTTIVIVTHNPGIADMADHVIRMNSGKIVEEKYNEKTIDAEQVKWS